MTEILQTSLKSYTKLTHKNSGFTMKELSKAKRALKKASIPKPWVITITNQETGEQDLYEL